MNRGLHTGVRLPLVTLVLAAALAMTPAAAQIPDVRTVDHGADAAMRNYLTQPAVAHHYSASRRLEASGSGQRGWLDVHTEFSAPGGFVYTVMAEGGSGIIRGRVLRSLLNEEQQLIAKGASASVAISPANYAFTAGGVDAEGLAIVDIRPLRRERSLIIGRMFLSADGSLVRVEGRLAKNPSFWVSRVNVVRTYERINGVVLPVALDTTATLRLMGSSSLRMTYHYSHVDGQAIGAALPD